MTGSGDGSGRLFIVERAGRIRVLNQTNGLVQAINYLDIASRISSGGERGLLGLAFHPDFPTQPFLYVNYTAVDAGQLVTRISRFRQANSGITADASSEQILLSIDQPDGNHNAGDLAFGPDGYLYIPTGDGGGTGDPFDNGQDFGSLLGKMLRIDVDNPTGGRNYGIPADNPFLVAGDTIPDEIYAVGLRNPWRISFDRETGDLYIGDVGQGLREEVNFQAANTAGGQNYGWDCREGLRDYPGSNSANCANGTIYTEPIFDYEHNNTNGGYSITGGFVYRGTADDLKGTYIAADYLTDRIFLTPAGGGSVTFQDADALTEISAFGEDDNGELYVLELDNGALHRVTTAAALPVDLISWSATPRDKQVQLEWRTASEQDASGFRLERSKDGVGFSALATIPAYGTTNQARGYEYVDASPLSGRSYYRLTQRDLDGTENVYGIRTVDFGPLVTAEAALFPNPTNGDFTLRLPVTDIARDVRVDVVAMDGRRISGQRFDASLDSRFDLRLPSAPAGLYKVVLRYGKELEVRKLMVR